MHPALLLFILFLVVPTVEIYVLIKVGGIIGTLPTIFLIVFTAVLGALLLRYQGFVTLRNFQISLGGGRLPTLELMEGMVLLVAGALLLTPGFITDTLGFLCLVPPLRRGLIRWLLRRYRMTPGPGPADAAGSPAGHRPGPVTIDGEYRREND